MPGRGGAARDIPATSPLIGAALVARAWAGLGIAATPLNLAYLALAVLTGGAIFIALNLITAVSAFWIVNSTPVTQVVFNTSEFAKYPLAIYPRAIGMLMTVLIPYGFASFYPASHLIGRDVGALAWLAGINVLLAIFNVLPAAPLDGGRLLRAAVWKFTGDRTKASVVAARAGWVLGVVDRSAAPERLQPLYCVGGEPLGSEGEISELPGYLGSRPVRVGNLAAHQLQLDVFGPIVDLVALLSERDAPLSAEHWRLVEGMVSAVAARWQGGSWNSSSTAANCTPCRRRRSRSG